MKTDLNINNVTVRVYIDTSDSDSWTGLFTAEFEDGECVTIKQNKL